MKVNFACGRQTWDGFYCVDAVPHPKATRQPDLIHAFQFDGQDLINPLPLADECAEEVHAYHFIEHVYSWQSAAVIGEFLRLLRHGGLLVLELPNLEHACRNLLNGTKDQLSMWPLYGDPGTRDPFMCHRWGYTPTTITALLEDCGARDIRVMDPQTHGKRANRDMRAEAFK